ncbi:hypothetical protein BSM4216_2395 [Bacillus smithii]|nr:hypothetical protein BSM4216_2395 [Bacillus smithii]
MLSVEKINEGSCFRPTNNPFSDTRIPFYSLYSFTWYYIPVLW